MSELNLENTLGQLGFMVLSADTPEDIDRWPSLASLFPIPSKYSISHYNLSHTHEEKKVLIVKNLDYATTIKLILLLQSDGYYSEEFIRDFLSLEGYCCFMTLDGEYIAEKE